jgi:hypothetical protein
MVPLGDFHIFLRLNSFTRASSGVMVAHFTPTPWLLDGVGRVDRHLIVGGVTVLHAQVVVVQLKVQIREDQLVLDHLPDDAGHLVAVDVHNRVVDLDLGHGFSSLSSDGEVSARSIAAAARQRKAGGGP